MHIRRFWGIQPAVRRDRALNRNFSTVRTRSHQCLAPVRIVIEVYRHEAGWNTRETALGGHISLANVFERLARVEHAVVQMADSSTPVPAVGIVVCLTSPLLLEVVVDLMLPLYKERAEGDSTGHNDGFIW